MKRLQRKEHISKFQVCCQLGRDMCKGCDFPSWRIMVNIPQELADYFGDADICFCAKFDAISVRIRKTNQSVFWTKQFFLIDFDVF